MLRAGEDSFLVLPLLALMALPLVEMALRRFRTGISGAAVFVQHFTLIVGMVGGAIAAREGRLLSFSTLANFFKGKLKAAALVVSSGTASAISAFLCVASFQFLLTEKASGGQLAYGIPLWMVELVLPIGFWLIAIRLIWQAAPGWKGRVLALSLAGAIVLFGAWSPISPETMLVPALLALLVAILLGAPVFTAIGGAALILFWADHSPIAAIALKHYSLVTHPSLPTIPLFTLAGYFLAGEWRFGQTHLPL